MLLAHEKSHNGRRMSNFCVTVTKHPGKDNLKKGKFYLRSGFRPVQSIAVGRAWQNSSVTSKDPTTSQVSTTSPETSTQTMRVPVLLQAETTRAGQIAPNIPQILVRFQRRGSTCVKALLSWNYNPRNGHNVQTKI